MAPSGKRRRPHAPPMRLAWPSSTPSSSQQQLSQSQRGNSSQDFISSSQQSASSDFAKVKRVRRTKSAYNSNKYAKSSVSSITNNYSLWSEKYAPCCVKDLCVAPKKVQECFEWIRESLQSNRGRLLVLVGSPGIGKSTMIRCLASEHDWSIAEWNEASSVPFQSTPGSDYQVAIENQSPLNSFEDFLRKTGTGYRSLDIAFGKEKSSSDRKTIILLESLPNLTVDTRERFREILGQHLKSSVAPTILVFSDVFEGRHKPEDLEALIPKEVLYTNLTLIMQIQAATKSRLKAAISTAVLKEGFRPDPELYASIYERSGGNIRSALSTLQYELCGGLVTKKAKSADRDSKLSTFHALGKLLYAKRESISMDEGEMAEHAHYGSWLDDRPKINFDPEEVLERCDMGLSGAIHFLEAHCTSFFSDITELSRTLETFSDASVMMEDIGRGTRGVPEAYSLAGRAVAAYNRNPAPNKFRQFSKPRIFDVIRQGKEQATRLQRLHQRLSHEGGELSLQCSLTATGNFVSDTLPYIRRISPSSVGNSIDSIHARVNLQKSPTESHESRMQALQQKQSEVLKEDDIDEFDD